jgi:hypothetical protein
MKQATVRRSHDEPAPQPIRDALATMVETHGEVAAARLLRIGRQTVARALAGLPLREGTHAQLRERLQA